MKTYLRFAGPVLAVLLGITHTACGQNQESAKESGAKSSEKPQMQYVLHKAGTRGETNAGWLLAKHTFSFNDYYDPDRMNFGTLRVLNDDRIDPGRGFPTHGHNNMEIITIPLKGSVHHKDNMGNSGVINAGDIQVMSAGTGITHSEANNSKDDTLRLLQIWVLSARQNVQPRYDQMNGILNNPPKNGFKKILDPADTAAMFIYQDAVFSMGYFDKNKMAEYKIAKPGNGVYAFIIEGRATINGIEVNRRDGIGIWDVSQLSIQAGENLQILLMDVPMID